MVIKGTYHIEPEEGSTEKVKQNMTIAWIVLEWEALRRISGSPGTPRSSLGKACIGSLLTLLRNLSKNDCIGRKHSLIEAKFTRLFIGDDISMKSSNEKININNVCNLISVSSERFN